MYLRLISNEMFKYKNITSKLFGSILLYNYNYALLYYNFRMFDSIFLHKCINF